MKFIFIDLGFGNFGFNLEGIDCKFKIFLFVKNLELVLIDVVLRFIVIFFVFFVLYI